MDGMVEDLFIGSRRIGPGNPCFVIAEAGVNHNGIPQTAHDLVRVAAEAGADAVKFQTFRADSLVTPAAPKARYQMENTGAEETQWAMLHRLELPRQVFEDLARDCAERGILFLSTAFDEESADFLNELGMEAFKIPSGELTNLPLIQHCAGFDKPLLISTGMANLTEVEDAVHAASGRRKDRCALLHCLSNYPANPDEVNLRAMSTMERKFKIPVGYSDHTEGIDVALAAVAAGACVLEKHFTLDRSLPGPDHKASLAPEALAELVQRVHGIEKMLGHGRKEPTPSEQEVARVARRSIVAASDLNHGVTLTREMLAFKRPGSGLAPKELEGILGRKLNQSLSLGTLIQWSHLE
jgi:N,N'-diacetyllegionaminate synthase